MRLFTAIELPKEAADMITSATSDLETLRWSNAEQLHITLCFLGNQPDNRFNDITDALSEVTFRPFQLKITDIGWFRGGIIYLKVERSSTLTELQRAMVNALHQHDIHFDQRKFIPHVTIARTKGQPDAVQLQHVASCLSNFSYVMDVNEFQLKSSILHEKGASHHTEGVFLP